MFALAGRVAEWQTLQTQQLNLASFCALHSVSSEVHETIDFKG